MATGPELSIVVPTHNTAALVIRCLETIHVDPAVADCEVIVVDDGSTDSTVEQIQTRFPRVQLLRNETAQGFSLAANRGLAGARAPLLWLLNSDTELEPGAIASVRAAFAVASAPDIVGAQLHYADGRPQWSGGAEPSLLWLFALTSGISTLLRSLPLYRRARPLEFGAPPAIDWVTGAALAMRTSTWQQYGPFDTTFGFYGQDLDFCRRASAGGARIELRPEIRVLHHHGASISPTAEQGRQNYSLLWGDLLHWAVLHRGTTWARCARLLMVAGASLRLAGRSLSRLLSSNHPTPAWSADHNALQAALSAIRERRFSPQAAGKPTQAGGP